MFVLRRMGRWVLWDTPSKMPPPGARTGSSPTRTTLHPPFVAERDPPLDGSRQEAIPRGLLLLLPAPLEDLAHLATAASATRAMSASRSLGARWNTGTPGPSSQA
jgi:hypothetical protein